MKLHSISIMPNGKTLEQSIGRDWTEDRPKFAKMLYWSKDEKGLSIVGK